MKSWDVIVIGGGVIGLSLAIELRRNGASVLVVERGQPGQEASHAAGGMLVDCALETPAALQPLATASARIYPEFVQQLQIESGLNADLRDEGTILLLSAEHSIKSGTKDFRMSAEQIVELEPALAALNRPAFYLNERSVDPRGLTAAALAAARRLGVEVSSGEEVMAVDVSEGRAAGVITTKTKFSSARVVNCAGAWTGQIAPHAFPTRPVKGQMLCLLSPSRGLLQHVIRTPEVYLIPRSDGRILVGATVEDVGFDKRTDLATIQRLHRAALVLVPELRNAKVHGDWAGLRPGTPDGLPILGATPTPGYFVATGHFRDGILLAPITARVMAQVVAGKKPDCNLDAFSPSRFDAR
jgi:glycine oxidase